MTGKGFPPKKPVNYSEEIAKEICDVVSTTPLMLEELCEQHPHWPTAKAIYSWRIHNKEFGERYARAKQSQIEPLVSRILLLSRDKSNDFYNDGESIKVNTAELQRKRMEIDSIKWFAAKLAPKLYGDKVQLTDDDGKSLLEQLIDKINDRK